MSKFKKSVPSIMHDTSNDGMVTELSDPDIAGEPSESYEAKGLQHQVGLLFIAAPFILAMVLIVAAEAIRHSFFS